MTTRMPPNGFLSSALECSAGTKRVYLILAADGSVKDWCVKLTAAKRIQCKRYPECSIVRFEPVIP